MTTIYSIGHSRHSIETFLELLRRHRVAAVVDVRSQPYSKWAPHFRKSPLSGALRDAGIDYRFLGGELGGRPDGDDYYDADGRVDYQRRAEAADFQRGIETLAELARTRPTVFMCAEEDPDHCHRRLLVTPALRKLGLTVLHIRGDGSLQPDDEPQLSLFE